jgi:hypothetical protein
MRAPANDNAIDCPHLGLARRVAFAEQRRLMRARKPIRHDHDTTPHPLRVTTKA